MKIEINNLQVGVEGTKILCGVNLTIESGTLNVLMGPNGSGKSTVANVIMGNPNFEVFDGSILVDGKDITELKSYERARLGLLMSFQDPVEVTGVTVGRFLRRAYEVLHGEVPTGFVKILREEVARLKMDQNFINRYLNEGFSGGEKKRVELLQMRVLKPKFVILDEIDSGLDIDAIRIIGKGINDMRKENPSISIMVVTHYRRIVDHLDNPHSLYVMNKGQVVQSGNIGLLDKLEEEGYGWLHDEGVLS